MISLQDEWMTLGFGIVEIVILVKILWIDRDKAFVRTRHSGGVAKQLVLVSLEYSSVISRVLNDNC